jgi:PhnB protein
MTMQPEKRPEAGYHTVIAYLMSTSAESVIAFAREVFGAEESQRLTMPDGKIAHAALKIGDSIVMITDAGNGPRCVASPATLYVLVEDTDATYRSALRAGGTSVAEPADMFWGHRFGAVKDPTGNTWQIATPVEDVAPDELRRRAAEHVSAMSSA